MIQIFLEHANTTIATIEQRSADGAVDDIAAEAHRLKGSSRLLGFTQIGALCVVLEESAARHDISNRTTVVTRLREAYAYVCQWHRAQSIARL
jgi:HPt (histidine-containing phosphotransfer) domain-containing protein